MVMQGRELNPSDIEGICGLIQAHPEWNRTRLSRELCALWDWRNAAGRPKDMAARTLLLKLDRAGCTRCPHGGGLGQCAPQSPHCARLAPEDSVPEQTPEVYPRLDFAMPVLAVAFVLFLFSQVLALRQTASALAWLLENLDRQAGALQSVRSDAAGLLKQRQGLVEETQRLSNSYNSLFTELMQLAQTDKDARSVVEKFNIKNSAPAKNPTSEKK